MFNLTTKAYIAATEAMRNLKKDERGVTAIEYGLIAIAMAVLIVFVFSDGDGFVAKLSTKFKELGSTLSSFKV